MPMIITHYSLVDWDSERWPNFRPSEFACKSSGEFYHDPESFDMIQRARKITGRPYRINSAHRSALHNARVGGAPLSQHKKMAFDISTIGHDRHSLLNDLKRAGFSSFGLYQTFIHADKRKNRLWYGGEYSRKLWNG